LATACPIPNCTLQGSDAIWLIAWPILWHLNYFGNCMSNSKLHTQREWCHLSNCLTHCKQYTPGEWYHSADGDSLTVDFLSICSCLSFSKYFQPVTTRKHSAWTKLYFVETNLGPFGKQFEKSPHSCRTISHNMLTNPLCFDLKGLMSLLWVDETIEIVDHSCIATSYELIYYVQKTDRKA